MAGDRILVLADDLTGALEVGSKFAAAGVRSLVRPGPSLLPQDIQDANRALVVDTETRHAGAAEAAQTVRELALAARRENFSRIYKKTDSTLRGNIGAELAALIDAYAGSPLLYVPAYPQMGRTVRNSCLYVNGVLAGDTSFATDPLNPVRESHIPTMLAAQCRLPIQPRPAASLADSGPWSIAICDGETDAEVEAAARAFVTSPTFKLAAGPSGFAGHLARLLDMPPCQPPALPSVRNGLIVSGSLNELSLQQVEQAKREGFRSIGSRSPLPITDKDDWIILQHQSAAGEVTLEFARNLAQSVCCFLAQFPTDVLVVFGGDTAYAIVEAMGNPPLHLVSEVMEGIPIARIAAKHVGGPIGHRDRDLYLVTKAGGFGPLNVLTSIRDALRER